MTSHELTIVARALRNRAQVCNTLAWEAHESSRQEVSSRLRKEAATCLNLIGKFEAAQTAPKRPCKTQDEAYHDGDDETPTRPGAIQIAPGMTIEEV